VGLLDQGQIIIALCTDREAAVAPQEDFALLVAVVVSIDFPINVL